MATIAELLASGGYDWLIILMERRKEYMAVLEKASVEGDIVPFVKFLSSIAHSYIGVKSKI